MSCKAGQLGVPMPRYEPPPKLVSEKGRDNMYPMTHMDFTVNDVQNRYEDVIVPLSLFAPYPHEDEPPSEGLQIDRPVTPINDEIKAPPPTFNKLAKLIRRRINAKKDVSYLTTEDQQALAAVLMGEANGIWTDLKQQVNDPFLTDRQNKELQRRITVHIVTVCQQLFLHYLQKAQILNRRGVFSGPANMCRLKAQLALDANKFLNVLAVRRHIVDDMRKASSRDSDSDIGEETKDGAALKISHQGFMDLAHPKSKGKKSKQLSTQEDLREISRHMPQLETGKVLDILCNLPEASRTDSPQTVPHLQPSAEAHTDTQPRRAPPTDVTKDRIMFRKCQSVPLLNYGETLLEELGIGNQDIQPGRVTSIGTEDVPALNAVSPQEDDRGCVAVVDSGQKARLDLHQLLHQPADQQAQDAKSEHDLPPLIQLPVSWTPPTLIIALTRSAKHDGRREEIEKQLKELQERERKREEEERVDIKEPTHPQPATVSTKLPNQMVVRTSDIRVSERVCMSSVTVAKNQTVYNDLIDEIDAATVKQLDSNLFLGDEISEVYKEIMKTVATDHMQLENDDMVEPTAESVNLTGALASSTLGRPKKERIVNSHLSQTKEPPWAQLGLQDWAKTPISPPKDFRGRPQFETMTPQGDLMRADPHGTGGYGGAGPENAFLPPVMAEIASRSYASWLNWWKNTINSDDYMKYLSTQETDYMGVIFHFYDSEDDGDDYEACEDGRVTAGKSQSQHTQLSSKAMRSKEREDKRNDLLRQKSDYQEGMWNVNSILLGGLGKDPMQEEDERSASTKPEPVEDDSTLKASHSKTRVVSRKSQLALQQEADHENLQKISEIEPATTEASIKSGSQSCLSTRKSASSLAVSAKTGLSAQDRLEKVWAALRMPDGQKLNMAIKYSSDAYHPRLEEAIEHWEKATNLIVQRETVLAKLEAFERLASDPNRFFEKGYRGSSVARLDEAKVRSSYYQQIDAFDNDIKDMLGVLKDKFQDCITYQGRPYADKLQWDRTEMLYWLQEERKQQAINYEARLRQIPLSMTPLQPVMPPV